MTDRDSAYVDIQDPVWVNGGSQFLYLSDRDGWRQLYLYDRSGRCVRQLTRDGMDVLSVVGVDERRGDVYVQAAAPDPTQRQIYRASLDGRRWQRVTTQPGTHNVSMGPDAHWMVDFHTTAATPTTAVLYEMPAMRQARVLQENARLKQTLAALDLRAPEFFKVADCQTARCSTPIAWCRPNFDSTRRTTRC